MKKAIIFGNLLAVWLVVSASPAVAEEYTTTTSDPVLDAYRYTAPANSWYAAKIKPKLKAQMKAKAPPITWEVGQPSVSASQPDPFLDEKIANSPVAKSPESTGALPFWQDIPAKPQ